MLRRCGTLLPVRKFLNPLHESFGDSCVARLHSWISLFSRAPIPDAGARPNLERMNVDASCLLPHPIFAKNAMHPWHMVPRPPTKP